MSTHPLNPPDRLPQDHHFLVRESVHARRIAVPAARDDIVFRMALRIVDAVTSVLTVLATISAWGILNIFPEPTRIYIARHTLRFVQISVRRGLVNHSAGTARVPALPFGLIFSLIGRHCSPAIFTGVTTKSPRLIGATPTLIAKSAAAIFVAWEELIRQRKLNFASIAVAIVGAIPMPCHRPMLAWSAMHSKYPMHFEFVSR